MQHPEEGIIHAWLDGALSAGEASAIESHVASCADCAARVTEARGLIAASSRIVSHLDAVPGNVIPLRTRRPRLLVMRNPWLGGAIAAALVLAVGVYSRMPKGSGVREPSPVAQAPIANPTAATDSARAIIPVPSTEPQRRVNNVAAGEKRTSTLADAASPPTLPPANATVQKASAPAAQPAPISLRSAPVVRSEIQPSETRPTAADVARLTRGRVPAGGVAAGAAAASAPAMMAQRALRDEPMSSPAAFTGCYEMSASTDVLPARFALTSDSSAISGLLAIHYVDADGRSSSRIQDLGWMVEDGQIVVKTQAREPLLTLRKTGSAVSGDGRSGSRNGRVVSCAR